MAVGGVGVDDLKDMNGNQSQEEEEIYIHKHLNSITELLKMLQARGDNMPPKAKQRYTELKREWIDYIDDKIIIMVRVRINRIKMRLKNLMEPHLSRQMLQQLWKQRREK